MKKPDYSFWKVILLSVAIVLFLALMDLKGMAMWKVTGQWPPAQSEEYTDFFWTFAYVFILGFGIVYYLLKRDLSEALAVVMAPVLLLWGGLEDLLFYYIGFGGLVDSSMPWLFPGLDCAKIYCHSGMGLVARAMGLDTVTPASLWLSVVLFSGLTFLAIRWLRRQKW